MASGFTKKQEIRAKDAAMAKTVFLAIKFAILCKIPTKGLWVNTFGALGDKEIFIAIFFPVA